MKTTSTGRFEKWLDISVRSAHERQTGFFSVAGSIISHVYSYLEYPLQRFLEGISKGEEQELLIFLAAAN